ncbi:peroxiredoxin [Candidatus Albibeggiatoa sp. nov. NOAA]|uniref:peroxiredoxin n=1 Tax=Candidatus Albibeggiatoa sp. nov. NOAA TaxID=3162724 RepID=UPI0032F3A297|nr:peroxiredoxin [Thiotrichaceae bacterium]
MTMEIGSPLPDITLPATNNQDIKLASLKGQVVVLYFYPRDNTPGCTQEGKDFTEKFTEFQNRNVLILGVSRDTVRKHENFKAKYTFPFELLADVDEVLCEAYGVMKNKKMFGKDTRGIERSTYIYDKAGTLQKVWRKVKVDGHVDEVLAAVDELAT